MIGKDYIAGLVGEWIRGTGLFLVDIYTGHSNDIRVYVDSMEGVTVETCVEMSRWLEKKLDERGNNFSLEVSSPGLDMPLRVRQQYEKNLGRDVEVVFKDGKKRRGTLLEVNDEGLKIEVTEKALSGGSQKKKKPVKAERFFAFDEIKSTKVVISFK